MTSTNTLPTINGSFYTSVTTTRTNAIPTINGSVYTSITMTRTNAVPTINGCVIPQSQRPVRTPYQRLIVLFIPQ